MGSWTETRTSISFIYKLMSKALTPTQRRAFHKPIKKKQPKRPSAADAEREDALEFDRKMAEMREHVRARLSNSEQSA